MQNLLAVCSPFIDKVAAAWSHLRAWPLKTAILTVQIAQGAACGTALRGQAGGRQGRRGGAEWGEEVCVSGVWWGGVRRGLGGRGWSSACPPWRAAPKPARARQGTWRVSLVSGLDPASADPPPPRLGACVRSRPEGKRRREGESFTRPSQRPPRRGAEGGQGQERASL